MDPNSPEFQAFVDSVATQTRDEYDGSMSRPTVENVLKSRPEWMALLEGERASLQNEIFFRLQLP